MRSIFGYLQSKTRKQLAPKEDFRPGLEVLGKITSQPTSTSFHIFFGVLILVFLVFGYNLFQYQVVEGSKNLYLAEGNRVRVSKVSAPRGIIFDRHQKALVKNILRYDIEIAPNQMPANQQARIDILKRVFELTGMKVPQEIVLGDNIYSSDSFIVKEDISQEEALVRQIEFDELEGVSVVIKPLRQYDENYGLAHIIGYIGKISPSELEERADYSITDWIGKMGIEMFYEEILRGEYGQKQIEVDAKGRLQRVIATFPVQKGKDISLSIDSELQKIAFESLEKTVEELGNGKGVAIALNPQNGEVLSIVSLPSYNNNIFVKPEKKDEIFSLFADKSNPMLNRAIAGLYPIGSTIKPLVATIALDNRVVSENFAIDTPLEIKIGDWVFPDWKDHGLTDIRRAIAESNNIFFYALGGGWDKIKGLGIERLAEGLRKFHIDKKTGIDLPGEKQGIVPDSNWKKKIKGENWYLGDTYHLSIGQGDVLVTPIELITAISSIANGGRYISPHFIQGDEKVVSSKISNDDNLKIVKEGMKMAWEEGSARAMLGLKDEKDEIIVGGAKTGTAQTGKKNSQGDDITHAWFSAFAPFDNPEIAVLVLVEEGGEGYSAALPVARKMMEEYFQNNNSSS